MGLWWFTEEARKLGMEKEEEEAGGMMIKLAVIVAAMAALVAAELWRRRRRGGVYLIDYACGRLSDEESKTNIENLLYFATQWNVSAPDLIFQTKVFLKSGIGQEAYVPRANLQLGRHLPMSSLLHQSDCLFIGAVHLLLQKTRVHPSSIDLLIVNCGSFNPTPSLASLIVNRFGLRSDVKSYHLAGMGCSASLISIQIAERILQTSRRQRLALVVCGEVLHQLYDGKDRSMMVTNCLFRSAATALLLSNREAAPTWGGAGVAISAKMKLRHLVRTNLAAEDEAHGAVVMEEDSEGLVGARLSTELIKVAGKAIRLNLKELAPKVLPWKELWRAAACWILKKEFVPRMEMAMEHVCIHPGSKAVIEGVARSLSLSKTTTEASLMALHRFGNTSCSGIWYELAYTEAKRRLKPLDRVLQLGLGSGFKCNSAAWTVLRTDDLDHFLDRDRDRYAFLLPDNPWFDCIHRYPPLSTSSLSPQVIEFLGLSNSEK